MLASCWSRVIARPRRRRARLPVEDGVGEVEAEPPGGEVEPEDVPEGAAEAPADGHGEGVAGDRGRVSGCRQGRSCHNPRPGPGWAAAGSSRSRRCTPRSPAASAPTRCPCACRGRSGSPRPGPPSKGSAVGLSTGTMRVSHIAGSLVLKMARFTASSASRDRGLGHDHRLLAAGLLGFRLHHVQGGHGADADLDLVLFEELRGQGQALALRLQVVDGVEEVVIRLLHVGHGVDHRLAERDVGDLLVLLRDPDLGAPRIGLEVPEERLVEGQVEVGVVGGVEGLEAAVGAGPPVGEVEADVPAGAEELEGAEVVVQRIGVDGLRRRRTRCCRAGSPRPG